MKSKFIIYLGVLRITACFSLLLLHCSALIVVKYGQIGLGSWFISNIYNSISRYSVAVFFMISGALILSKNDNILDFYKKRISKVIVPFIFWQIFYVFVSSNYQISTFLASLTDKHTYYQILFGYTHYHLWFVQTLIQIYLISPLLKEIVKSNKNNFKFFMIVFMSFIILNDVVFLVWGRRYFTENFLPALGFFIAGYFLNQSKSLFKFTRKTKFPIFTLYLIIISILVIVFATYILTKRKGLLDETFYLFYNTPNMIISFGVFSLIKYYGNKFSLFFTSNKRKNILQIIDRSSYGIYLVHAAIIGIFIKSGVFGFLFPQQFNWKHVVVGIPIYAFCVYTVSLVTVLIIKNIPFVNRIV